MSDEEKDKVLTTENSKPIVRDSHPEVVRHQEQRLKKRTIRPARILKRTRIKK